MRPVTQDEARSCLSACVASILGVPLNHVPPLRYEHQLERCADWLALRGRTLTVTPIAAGDRWRPSGEWIAITDERDGQHATVWRGRDFAFNPWGARAGPPSGKLVAALEIGRPGVR